MGEQLWSSEKVRSTFLNFFESKKHRVVSSAPMVIKNDPTLMFTNAGMNQFKDLFLGNSPIQYPRITNSQKCLRVSGKHNDLEEVGVDTYHHTMFEMLGNWSFGDYFKKEAIKWAWELLTAIYKIDKNRLYVTVFEGSEEDGVPFDQEAYDYWAELIDENRILRGNKKDNFWEMGETGPCGPCTEIHCDIRSDEERKKIDGKQLVNADHPQVVEIWNNVFMEFNRKADGSLVKLTHQHVDTGMGFERLCTVLQGKQSNYDTDVFQYLIKELEKKSKIQYGFSEKTDIAMRVISDHLRAISFSIADGQLPSNTGAGYVIRRILRRAIRYGYSFLDFKSSFLTELIPFLVEKFGTHFPELSSQQTFIETVVREEEESFLRTLENGIEKFNKYSESIVSGAFAFELYDTYGFPIDLTQLLAKERQLTVDMEEFQKCLQEQKNRSRKATSLETEDWVVISDNESTEFVGYDVTEASVTISKIRKIKTKGKELYQLVFDKTPFYPEGGGQVGDTGIIQSEKETIKILDTKKENNQIIHFSDKLPTDLSAQFVAKVDDSNRFLTANNHSATHLLHHVLREILGKHVEQKGSLVTAEYLRFDFSHFQKLSEDELEIMESKINRLIQNNIELAEFRNLPLEEAKSMGAMALFGEKYGDTVRVIKFGDSVELCGGIHVKSTGQIGFFKIVSESAVAAGVRRIEAISSVEAEKYIKAQLNELKLVKELLKNPKDAVKAITDLLNSTHDLQKKIESFNREKVKSLKTELKQKTLEINGVNLIAEQVSLDSNAIKDLAFQLKEDSNTCVLLCNAEDNKVGLTIALSNDLVESNRLNAGNIIKELAKEIKGGGGGQAFFATAGGKDVSGISRSIEKIKSML